MAQPGLVHGHAVELAPGVHLHLDGELTDLLAERSFGTAAVGNEQAGEGDHDRQSDRSARGRDGCDLEDRERLGTCLLQ